MTFRQRLEQIRQQMEQISRDEALFEAERTAALAALPARFGFGDVEAFIKALTGACRGKRAPVARRKRGRERPAAEVAAVSAAEVAANVEPRGLARAQAEKEPEPPAAAPTGASLDDPANFGLMPDFSLLGVTAPLEPAARERLSRAFAFATRVLHTSRIPAAVWREWRRFEKGAAELLRQ